jgi:hypothetical protein
MFALCNSTGFISEGSLDKGNGDGGVVGLAIHVMVIILMQAGCLIEQMRLDVIHGRMSDIWERPTKQRAAHWKHFVEAVKKYVPPVYDHVIAELTVQRDGCVKLNLWPMLRGTAVTYRPLGLFDERPHGSNHTTDPIEITKNLAEVTTREVVIRAFGGRHYLKEAQTPEEVERVRVANAIERERNPTMYL